MYRDLSAILITIEIVVANQHRIVDRFIENVDSLNEDVAKLTPALDQINNLTNVVETASAGLVKIGEKVRHDV